ncbi:Branched-chain amino acid transport system ATP-binding protein OS=Castellaniella defragrans OX=75697 GN=HNR28_000341 PE=3 SV=1 [Castellaniella defragrans]
MASMLEVQNLVAGYGRSQVLHGLDLSLPEGGTAVILGANGAGKTTTLRALSGMIGRQGSVRFDGADIGSATAEQIVRLGIAHIPQGRGTFASQTVEENLRIGAYVRRDKDIKNDIERFYGLFPVLGKRRMQPAGQLSGGEQQMLAVARALMLRPRLLLLDEPSLGLAPIIVKELFTMLASLRQELKLTMLLVEQNARLAMSLADQVYVLESGVFVRHGPVAQLQDDPMLVKAYLGA